MRNTSWRPYILFGLMIGFVLVIGLGIVFLGILRGGDVGPGLEPTYANWWPALWGTGPFVLVFPCVGFGIMILMMLFMLSRRGSRRGHMGRGSPMGWMWSGGPRNSRRQSPASETGLTCSQCDAPLQTGWNVCPKCGASLN